MDTEKLIKEQANQIESLKKAIILLQRQLMLVSKKTDRTYHTGKKNANDINSIQRTLRSSG